MVLLGLGAMATSMALGVYGLTHRGLELIIGASMLVLFCLGLWMFFHGLGL